MTMQSWGLSLFGEFKLYRFFAADFFDRDRRAVFAAADLELPFDADAFLLADLLLPVLFFEPEDFFAEAFTAGRPALRDFSAIMRSVRSASSSSLNALSAFGKSSFSSSSTWCSTFSCSTFACASHSSFAVLALLSSFSSVLTTACSS